MIACEVMSGIAPGAWAELVSSCGGNPLHLPQALLVENGPADLRYLCFRERGRTVACALAAVETARRYRIGPLRRRLVLPTTPAWGDAPEAEQDRILQALVDHGRRQGWSGVHVDGRWGTHHGSERPYARWVTRTSLEFVLRLDRSFDDVLAGMERNHRKNIRRAERSSLVVAADSSLGGLLELRSLQARSSERAAGRGNPFSVRDEAFFRRFHKTLFERGPGALLLARAEGTAIAALAWLAWERKAITIRSGANEEGYRSFAMYGLHGALIRRLQDEGVVELNLGAVPVEAAGEAHPQHGLYLFKKGFGGFECPRSTLDLPSSAASPEGIPQRERP